MVTTDDVKKLAELALLEVSEEEVRTLATEMEAILAYVSELKAVTGEEEAREVPALRNVMREDANPTPANRYTQALLDEVPMREGRYVKVRKIL